MKEKFPKPSGPRLQNGVFIFRIDAQHQLLKIKPQKRHGAMKNQW